MKRGLRLLLGGLSVAAGCALADPLGQTFGPDGRTIREEIASYPAERQEAFDLMRRRCMSCHTLNEPFAAHIPEGTWRSQVRRMARKPGAAIRAEEAERIADFMEYFAERRGLQRP